MSSPVFPHNSTIQVRWWWRSSTKLPMWPEHMWAEAGRADFVDSSKAAAKEASGNSPQLLEGSYRDDRAKLLSTVAGETAIATNWSMGWTLGEASSVEGGTALTQAAHGCWSHLREGLQRLGETQPQLTWSTSVDDSHASRALQIHQSNQHFSDQLNPSQ